MSKTYLLDTRPVSDLGEVIERYKRSIDDGGHPLLDIIEVGRCDADDDERSSRIANTIPPDGFGDLWTA